MQDDQEAHVLEQKNGKAANYWHYIQRCRDKQMINTYIRAYLTNLTSHFDIIWELRGAHSTSVFSEMEAI